MPSQPRDTAYSNTPLAKKLGVIVTAHCENPDLIVQTQKKLISEGKTGPEWHYWSRSEAHV